MWLEEIALKDFRCFYGEHVLELSSDDEKNVTLIHAENGVGKTTLLNAMLWCFYNTTTAKFERKHDLVNHDAVAAGRNSAYVEVLFEHNDKRYRARRYTGSGLHGDRSFSIMRLDDGHNVTIDNPDTFINTVIPKTMVGHFLFDGEHAEIFLGEENRGSIRQAVQDILGCKLIETAIDDLADSASHYRRQMPKTQKSASITELSEEIENIEGQLTSARAAVEGLKLEADNVRQQIADIDDKLRNSAASKELQSSRERVKRQWAAATKRATDAQDEVLKWLGDYGRFLVSTRITEQAFDHLEAQENKGGLPSPYNEEFVHDLLEMEKCICGTDLKPGTESYDLVKSRLHKAANATLRSRLNAVRATISQLKSEREKAPARLDAANKRLASARSDVSTAEAELGEISEKLLGIDFGEIAEREAKRNELQTSLTGIDRDIGGFQSRIAMAESQRSAKQALMKKKADTDDDARIFIARQSVCEALRQRLEVELEEEEEAARTVLRTSIAKVLAATSRKSFKLKLSDEYAVSLVNELGTQLPKSSGENQLLGLAFTAALAEFAKIRQNAQDHRLLRGTVAPLVLDSPFGQLDESYRRTTGEYVPKMASQVVLMVSGSQAGSGAVDALRSRVGREYVMVRTNKGARKDGAKEFKQLGGKDYETSLFDQEADGSLIVEVR
jgi:DNA sulfur modification protein DndD